MTPSAAFFRLVWWRHTQAPPWQDHPQLVQERQRRLLGWNRLGKPVWTTRQAPPPNGPEIHGPPPNHAWHQVAQQILHRDFEAEPADSSQLEAWRIGLRSLATQAAKAALARLEAVRLVRWGKKDLHAGRLLPRAAKEQA